MREIQITQHFAKKVRELEITNFAKKKCGIFKSPICKKCGKFKFIISYIFCAFKVGSLHLQRDQCRTISQWFSTIESGWNWTICLRSPTSQKSVKMVHKRRKSDFSVQNHLFVRKPKWFEWFSGGTKFAGFWRHVEKWGKKIE